MNCAPLLGDSGAQQKPPWLKLGPGALIQLNFKSFLAKASVDRGARVT